MPDLSPFTADLMVFIIGAFTMVFMSFFFADFLAGIMEMLRRVIGRLF